MILVVEDNPAIARLLEVQLRDAGWHPILAATGLDALRVWADYHFKLVLLDVMLPDLSGWDVCLSLRAESDVPIIMLTAKSSDQDVVQGLNLGADDYLCKPFTHAQLMARINAVMRRIHVPLEVIAEEVHIPEMPFVATTAASPAMPVETPPSGGALLRSKRHELGISLYGAERRCGIRWDYIQAMESGAFGSIPLPLLKEAMLKYCTFLGVDARPVFTHAQNVIMNTPEYRPQSRINVTTVVISIAIFVIIILPFVLNR